MADKCHLFLPPTLSHFWGPIQKDSVSEIDLGTAPKMRAFRVENLVGLPSEQTFSIL